MLAWCLVYLVVSIAFGALLGILGYRHRVWSRAHLRQDAPYRWEGPCTEELARDKTASSTFQTSRARAQEPPLSLACEPHGTRGVWRDWPRERSS